MKKKTLDDYDLDVMNAMKEFPETDEDAFVYVRSETDSRIVKGFAKSQGTPSSIINSFILIMSMDETYKACVLDASHEWLRRAENKEDLKAFRRLIGVKRVGLLSRIWRFFF
jgi:hypothetical protein